MSGGARAGVVAAYEATGSAWAAGPARVYDRLSEVLVARCPGGMRGRVVVDVGAGTGPASRAAVAAGATMVVGLDVAEAMLRVEAGARPPGVVADAVTLPLRPRSVDAAVAAFSLNHLADPTTALVELARVLRRGGALAVSAYATDDTHPVKAAVTDACAAVGWAPPPWHVEVAARAVPKLATAERARDVAVRAGLDGAEAERIEVAYPELHPTDLVAWRLGLAQFAPFVAGLAVDAQRALADDALARLGPDAGPLVRAIVILTWTKP